MRLLGPIVSRYLECEEVAEEEEVVEVVAFREAVSLVSPSTLVTSCSSSPTSGPTEVSMVSESVHGAALDL